MKKMIFLFMCLFIISGNLYAGGVIGVEKVDTSPTATANIGKIFIKRGIEEYGDDYKLMIHSDTENGDNNFIDSIQLHQIEAYGDMLHSADEKKFGASSIQFINGDYLSISDSNDWDICGNNSDSCTIDFWFYHTGFEDVECYVSQQEDKRNRWWLINRYGLGLVFRFKSNGKLMIDTDFGGSISNNKWHHMALIIKGNGSIKHIGVFLNGKQVTYASTSFIDRVEGDLCIGKIGDDGYAAFKGYIDEFRVINSNPFNASPNADKTDSITVPISEYTPTPGNLQLFYMDDEGNEYKVKLEKQ